MLSHLRSDLHYWYLNSVHVFVLGEESTLVRVLWPLVHYRCGQMLYSGFISPLNFCII